jgi:hypothetical protein
MSARGTARSALPFGRTLLRTFPHALAGSLVSISRSIQAQTLLVQGPMLWRQITGQLAMHKQHIAHIGRLMLIGYSSVVIVLTLGVIASFVWQHSPGVGDPARTAPNASPSQEAQHANASRTAHDISMDR